MCSYWILCIDLFYSVHVWIEERVSVAANRDGGLEQMEVRGVLTLRVGDAANARVRLTLQAADDPAINFKVWMQ